MSKFKHKNNIATVQFLSNFLYNNLNISIIVRNNTLHRIRSGKGGITYFSWDKLISVYNKGVDSRFFKELNLWAVPHAYTYMTIATPRKPITATRKELYKALTLEVGE
jgi:hypothetical protein